MDDIYSVSSSIPIILVLLEKVLTQEKAAKTTKKHTLKDSKFQGTPKYIVMTNETMN